jgi:hypothetical protein
VVHLKKHRDIPEIPRSQRYTDRPSLEKQFAEGTAEHKTKRNESISAAIENYDYRLPEVSDHLGMSFTSISRIVNTKK